MTACSSSVLLVYGTSDAFTARVVELGVDLGLPVVAPSFHEEACAALAGTHASLVILCADLTSQKRNAVVDAACAAHARVRWIDVVDQRAADLGVVRFWIDLWREDQLLLTSAPPSTVDARSGRQTSY